MPFRFEIRLWQLVTELACRLKPPGMESDRKQPWIFELGPDESVSAHTPSRVDLPVLEKQFQGAGITYLVFDPYDFPESFRLAWHRLPQRTAERLLGKPFEEADFAGAQRWPDSWTFDY
jgi:hypothetical protein